MTSRKRGRGRSAQGRLELLVGSGAAEQDVAELRVDILQPFHLLELVCEEDAERAHRLEPRVVQGRRREDARIADQGERYAGRHERVDQVIQGQQERLVAVHGPREIVSLYDAPADVAPEAALVQDVGLEQAQPPLRFRLLVGQREQAARGRRGVPAGGREKEVQRLRIGELVLALVRVVCGRARLGGDLLGIVCVVDEQAAPAGGRRRGRDQDGFGDHHLHGPEAVPQHHRAADPCFHLAAGQRDEVLHVEHPRVGAQLAVQVGAQPGPGHGGFGPREIAAQVVPLDTVEHARAPAGKAAAREEAHDASALRARGARERPVADAVERRHQLALGRQAALAVGGAPVVHEPGQAAHAALPQTVAPVLGDPGQLRVRARGAEDVLDALAGPAAGARGRAREQRVLAEEGLGVGPALRGDQGGGALRRGGVLADVEVEARKLVVRRALALGQLEFVARVVEQQEVFHVVQRVHHARQIEEGEILGPQLSEVLLLDDPDDAVDRLVGRERRGQEHEGLPRRALRHLGHAAQHLVDRVLRARQAAGRARIHGRGHVEAGLHLVAPIRGPRVRLDQRILEAVLRVLGDKRRRQDPLEDLVHEILQHVEPGAHDAHRVPQPRQHLDHVLLNVVAPHVQEPGDGLVDPDARAVQERHDLRPQLPGIEHGVHQEVPRHVQHGARLGPDVLPVRGDVLAHVRRARGQEEGHALDRDAHEGRQHERHLRGDDAHDLQYGHDQIHGVGRAPALVGPGKVQQGLLLRRRLERARGGVEPGVKRPHGVVHPRVVAGIVAGRMINEGVGHAVEHPARDAVGLLHNLARLKHR